MLLPDDVGVQDAGRGFQRVHGRIDAQRGDLAAEDRGGVEVAEGRGRGRVREVVRRHIDRLYRCDGAVLRGGDAFLHLAHFRGQRRLVAHGGGHTAQQGGDFGAGLRETEDVVDEEEDVLGAVGAAAVAE